MTTVSTCFKSIRLSFNMASNYDSVVLPGRFEHIWDFFSIYCCAEWGFIVAFTFIRVLTMYQIYHI
jgi:hypothetical protein